MRAYGRECQHFICLFYLLFPLSPPNTSLLKDNKLRVSQGVLQALDSAAVLSRPLQAPLQHHPHPLHRQAPWWCQTARLWRRPAIPPYSHAGLFFNHNCQVSEVLCLESQELESERKVYLDRHFSYRTFTISHHAIETFHHRISLNRPALVGFAFRFFWFGMGLMGLPPPTHHFHADLSLAMVFLFFVFFFFFFGLWFDGCVGQWVGSNGQQWWCYADFSGLVDFGF